MKKRIYTNFLLYLGSAVDDRSPPQCFPQATLNHTESIKKGPLPGTWPIPAPNNSESESFLPYNLSEYNVTSHTSYDDNEESSLPTASTTPRTSPLMNGLNGRIDDECCYYAKTNKTRLFVLWKRQERLKCSQSHVYMKALKDSLNCCVFHPKPHIYASCSFPSAYLSLRMSV